jgi:hypothetical protein
MSIQTPCETKDMQDTRLHAPPHPNPTCRAPFTSLPMQRYAVQSVICCYVFKQAAVLINMPQSQCTPPSTCSGGFSAWPLV